MEKPSEVSATKVETHVIEGDASNAEPDKKKKYSRGLKGVQRAERDLTRAHRRVAKAILLGIEKWEERRDESADKKRDGAMRDFPKNSAKALSITMREMSKVPQDVARMVSGKGARRMMRVAFPLARW